jgi:hypothetical protein
MSVLSVLCILLDLFNGPGSDVTSAIIMTDVLVRGWTHVCISRSGSMDSQFYFSQKKLGLLVHGTLPDDLMYQYRYISALDLFKISNVYSTVVPERNF